MAFKVQYVILADGVQEIQSGKLNVFGLFNQVNVLELPWRHPSFFIVAQLQAQNEDDLHQHQIDCRLVRPNGQVASQAGGTLNLRPNRGPGPLGLARIIIGMENVPIREVGPHRVVLRVDGRDVAEHPLTVVQLPAPLT